MRQTLVVSDPIAALARLEGVPSAIAAATAAVDVVLTDRGRRAVTPRVSAQARWASARANADLTDGPERWFPGALRAIAEIDDLAGLLLVAPAQAIARTHALVARGVLADRDLGRVRVAEGVADRLRDLGDLIVHRGPAPALVLAAVVHAELVTLAPFAAGNDVVARAVEHALLVGTGLDPAVLIVIEDGHRRAADYPALLRGYASGSVTGVRAWLLHAAAALTLGAERSPAMPPV